MAPDHRAGQGIGVPDLAFTFAAKGDVASPWCLLLLALPAFAIGALNLAMSRERASRFIGGVAAIVIGVLMMALAIVRWLA